MKKSSIIIFVIYICFPTIYCSKIQDNKSKIAMQNSYEIATKRDILKIDKNSFEYLLYIYENYLIPDYDLYKKYLLPSFNSDVDENGTYYDMSINEIYYIENIVIIVFTHSKNDYGSVEDNNYVATFTKDGTKIDMASFEVLITTEWNSIEINYELNENNEITRTCIDNNYSPENGGSLPVDASAMSESFKISKSGIISNL